MDQSSNNQITATERTVLVHCMDHGQSAASDAAYDLTVAEYNATIARLTDRGFVVAGSYEIDGETVEGNVVTSAGRAALVAS